MASVPVGFPIRLFDDRLCCMLYGEASSSKATVPYCRCALPRALAPIPAVHIMPDSNVRPTFVGLLNMSSLGAARAMCFRYFCRAFRTG